MREIDLCHAGLRTKIVTAVVKVTHGVGEDCDYVYNINRHHTHLCRSRNTFRIFNACVDHVNTQSSVSVDAVNRTIRAASKRNKLLNWCVTGPRVSFAAFEAVGFGAISILGTA